MANAAVVSMLACAALAGWVGVGLTSNPVVLSAVPLAVGSLSVTVLATVLGSQASWVSIGLPARGLVGVATGFLAAYGACALAVLAVLAAGIGEYTSIDPEVVRFDWRGWRAAGIAVLVLGACGEELFARGLVLQYLARALTPAGAVAVTSVAFALLHGSNPGVTLLAQCNTAVFGAVFGFAVLWRRTLWLAIGLHLGWNLSQVSLGVNTSGITMRLTDLNLVLEEPAWLTGGAYGLEGGLLATIAAALLVVLVRYLPTGKVRDSMLWNFRADAGVGSNRLTDRSASGRGFRSSGESGTHDPGPAE